MSLYQPVPLAEGEDDVRSSKRERHDSLRGPRSQQSPSRFALPASIVILCISLINLFVAKRFYRPTNEICTAQTSVWSPAFEAVDYVNYDFKNDFGHKGQYMGPPTTELEERWNELVPPHAVRIPQDKLPLLNRSMTGNYKLADETGYAALIEVFHQLHCLNRIRQYTWLQSGNYRPETVNDTQYEDIPVIPNDFRTSAIANRLHADHCIETLRLALMCHGDVTPVLIHVEPNAPLGERADFSSHHKCRDFGKLRQWMDDNVGTN